MPAVWTKSCSLNIKAMILKIVLFYSRYVKLDSVIYPALICHSFPSKWEIFCRKPLLETCKNKRKHQAKVPFVLLPSNNDFWMCSCILPSIEKRIPLNKLLGCFSNGTRTRLKTASLSLKVPSRCCWNCNLASSDNALPGRVTWKSGNELFLARNMSEQLSWRVFALRISRRGKITRAQFLFPFAASSSLVASRC